MYFMFFISYNFVSILEVYQFFPHSKKTAFIDDFGQQFINP